MKNLTVNEGGKIIREANSGGYSYLTISGNLVNNGEIVDYNDYFDISLAGNLVNNGILKPRTFKFTGQNQKVSGKGAIEAKNTYADMADEFLVAESDLSFKNSKVSSSVSGTPRKLKMGLYKLDLRADSITYDSYYGTAYSRTEFSVSLVFDETGVITNENAILRGTVYGDLNMSSPSFGFLKDLTVEGNLTIEDGSKFSGAQNLNKLRVKGNFINQGKLNADTVVVRSVEFKPRTMKLYVYGNCSNSGSTGITTVYPVTEGKDIVLSGDYQDVYLMQSETTEKPGGKVIVDSELNISGKLDVYANLEVKESGTLNILSKTLTSPVYLMTNVSITNKGNMSRYRVVNNSWSYRSFSDIGGLFTEFELRDWSDRIEGIDISVFNNQSYPGLPGTLKRWWRIQPSGTGLVKNYILKLHYSDNMLNGQKEENLKVYRTTDEGETWEVVSVGEFSVLDTVLNTITIGRWDKPNSMLTEFGDFVISSGDGSVPVESSIMVDMVGRPDVRVGAPNPFTIHVYNITDYRTNPVMLTMAVSEDIRFKEVRLPYNGGVEVLPVDSISDPNDLTQVFFIPYLEPNEHYSFDVIVYGLPESLKSATENMVTLTLGGFFGHAAKDEATDFIVEKVGEAVDLDNAEKEEYARGLGLTVNQLKTEKQQYGKTVTTIRHVSKYTVKKIADTNPVTKVLFTVGESVEAVHKIKDSLRRRLFHWFYKEVGLYGVEEKVASGKKVEGTLVSSWDPNAIVGPAGFGEKNFVTELPVFNYTIMFENKKEATAPAYRVQIIDTLPAVFNAETVKFLETSHSGANYKWKMERKGNVLKWDIEGIELAPNITPPEGEGFVRFSVEPTAGLPSGTVFENRATIIFDMNPAITTNTWVNITDTEAPVTKMATISYSGGDTQVNITCNSDDNKNGSGVGRYELYASVDSSPFVFAGESYDGMFSYKVSDSTKTQYRFYIVASDNVENAEKNVPDHAELNTYMVSVWNPGEIADEISVFPNPTDGLLQVSFKNVSTAETRVQIFSADGKLLQNENMRNNGSSYQTVGFDLSE
ncbi:MAG: hypothetical protein EP310_00385, partial [Bacteroidetes bacterium]